MSCGDGSEEVGGGETFERGVNLMLYDLGSLEFTWTHLVSLGLTWTHLISLGLT